MLPGDECGVPMGFCGGAMRIRPSVLAVKDVPERSSAVHTAELHQPPASLTVIIHRKKKPQRYLPHPSVFDGPPTSVGGSPVAER